MAGGGSGEEDAGGAQRHRCTHRPRQGGHSVGQGGHKRLYTRGTCRGGREPFVGFLSATATCIAKIKDDGHCGDHMHLLLQFRCPRPENLPRKPVEGVHEAFEAEQQTHKRDEFVVAHLPTHLLRANIARVLRIKGRVYRSEYRRLKTLTDGDGL